MAEGSTSREVAQHGRGHSAREHIGQGVLACSYGEGAGGIRNFAGMFLCKMGTVGEHMPQLRSQTVSTGERGDDCVFEGIGSVANVSEMGLED